MTGTLALLLSGGEDGTLREWDVESGQCIHIIQSYAISLYEIDWSPTGTRLASAGSDLLVTIWDSAGKTQPMLLAGHHYHVNGVAWSPDGRLLASCGEDNTIQVWDLASGEYLRTLRRDRPYERLDISGVKGLTDAQIATLRALGAIEEAITSLPE